MNHYSYEELVLGLKEEFSVVVTECMMRRFMEVTGDMNPLHIDEDFARKHHFSNRVVYGMLTASFLSTLGGMYLPGENCLIQAVEVKFVRPVFIGDELLVSGVIEERNESVSRIVLNVTITNQIGEKVLRGKMKLGVMT